MTPSTLSWATGAAMPPRLFRLSKYALPSFPSASTSCEGVAPGTSMSMALTPPRSVSPLIEREPIGRRPVVHGEGGPLKTGPACNRMIASPPIQLPPVLNVFPVITNMFVPSLATPLCPQIPPPSRCCRPAMHIRRIVNVHADNPAMIIAAVTEISGVRHVDDPVHKSQCASVFLQPGK